MKVNYNRVVTILVVASTSCDAASLGIQASGNLSPPSLQASQSIQHRTAVLDLHAAQVLAVQRAFPIVPPDDCGNVTHDAWKSHHQWLLQEGPTLPPDIPAWAEMQTQMMLRLGNQIVDLKNDMQKQIVDLKNDTQKQIADTQKQIADLKNNTQKQIADTQKQIADLKNDTQKQHSQNLRMIAKSINRQAIAPGDPIEFPPAPGSGVEPHDLPQTLSEFWSISVQQAQSLCTHYGVFPIPLSGEQCKAALSKCLGLRQGDAC